MPCLGLFFSRLAHTIAKFARWSHGAKLAGDLFVLARAKKPAVAQTWISLDCAGAICGGNNMILDLSCRWTGSIDNLQTGQLGPVNAICCTDALDCVQTSSLFETETLPPLLCCEPTLCQAQD